jgi:RND family efflux transporter MFP subunit
MLLRARLNLQSEVATLQNLQQTFDLDLTESDIDSARQIIDQDQVAILSLMARIESSSVIPQEIGKAIWAETSAQKALDLLKNPTLANLAAARAEVTEAEQAQSLAQDDRVGHDIAAVQAIVYQAQAAVDLVKQRLADTQIQAPFDGFVTSRWLSPGAVVSSQTPIVTVSSKEIVVSVQVEEASINALQQGQSVNLTTPVFPGRQLVLRVDRISPSGSQQAHTFSVQLSPAGIPAGLRPGMSGEVSVETQIEKVVLVPKQAILYREDGATLFVVRDGRAYLRKVTTGREKINEVEVRSGIQVSEQVVVSGHEYLQDVDRVALECTVGPPPMERTICMSSKGRYQPGAVFMQRMQSPGHFRRTTLNLAALSTLRKEASI